MNNATSEDYLRDEAQRDLAAICRVDTKFHVDCTPTTHYEPSTGCWIDGHWGIYSLSRLVEIAQDYGFVISDNDEFALSAYKGYEYGFIGDDGLEHDANEWVMEVAQDAEDWLNENIAREGYYFGWNDGEFFYMPAYWWSEDEDHIYRSEN